MPEMSINQQIPAATPTNLAPVINYGQMFNPNVKDSRWLTLEVCREYTRQKCTRTENECKFAHPPPHVEVQNGRVTCCFDSIKGKCQRKEPPCKYLHPPQHLREQLLQNGRNNLILRQLQAQAMVTGTLGIPPYFLPTTYEQSQIGTKVPYPSSHQVLSTAQYPVMPPFTMLQNPNPAFSTNPYHISPTGLPDTLYTGLVQAVDSSGAATACTVPTSLASIMATQTAAAATATPQKMARPDRIEANGSNGSEGTYSTMVSGVDLAPSSQYPGLYSLQASGIPQGMMPVVKRPAMDKTGVPMFQHQQQTAYQPTMAAAMQLNQQYVPVTQSGTTVPSANLQNGLIPPSNHIDSLSVITDQTLLNGASDLSCQNPSAFIYYDHNNNNNNLDKSGLVSKGIMQGECTTPSVYGSLPVYLSDVNGNLLTVYPNSATLGNPKNVPSLEIKGAADFPCERLSILYSPQTDPTQQGRMQQQNGSAQQACMQQQQQNCISFSQETQQKQNIHVSSILPMFATPPSKEENSSRLSLQKARANTIWNATTGDHQSRVLQIHGAAGHVGPGYSPVINSPHPRATVSSILGSPPSSALRSSSGIAGSTNLGSPICHSGSVFGSPLGSFVNSQRVPGSQSVSSPGGSCFSSVLGSPCGSMSSIWGLPESPVPAQPLSLLGSPDSTYGSQLSLISDSRGDVDERTLNVPGYSLSNAAPRLQQCPASRRNILQPRNSGASCSTSEVKSLAIPICRDFRAGKCARPNCKFVHNIQDSVKVDDGAVRICVEALKGQCKELYHHIPQPHHRKIA